MDFNPATNIHVSISKNTIYLVNIKETKNFRKMPNFNYFKSEKPNVILSNLSTSI